MAIFARRVIQRMLDENRGFLSDAAVGEHVRRLNGCNADALATEWEVFILNRLRGIGTVRYEEPLGGSKRPDVLFESDSVSGFLADVRTVSDKNSEKENPVEYFYDCVKAYLAKKGPGAFGVNVRVDGEAVGEYGDQKVHLHLPVKGEIPTFVKEHFAAVAKRIKSQPQESFTTTVGQGRNRVQVAYNPGERSFSGGYISPSSPLSLKRNPVYKSLKRKSEQLRDCQHVGVKGVFLCDGSCHALRFPTPFLQGSQFTPTRIIHQAFKDNSSLSFVVVVSVEEKHKPLDPRVDRVIRADFLSNPQAKCIVGRRFWSGLKRMFENPPTPIATPRNALYDVMARKHEGISFLGGGSMSNGEVKIPSRTLTEILAGTVDYHKAREGDISPLGSIAWMKRYFYAQLKAGRTIAEISVEKCPDQDDDWIKIKYCPRDPPLSMFK